MSEVDDGTKPIAEGDDNATVVRDINEERTKRVTKNTERSLQYRIELCVRDFRLATRRLENQKKLFVDLLQTDNVEMVNREVIKLDNLFDEMVTVVGRLRDVIDDDDKLLKLSEDVDAQDTAVFEIKQKVSRWMVLVAEADTKSNSSKGSKRSKRSVKSHHSQSHSFTSSQESRVSQKAIIAGMKAEEEALKKSEEAEIEAKVIEMRAKTESARLVRDARLKVEISRLEGKIAREEAVRSTHVEEKGQVTDVHRCTGRLSECHHKELAELSESMLKMLRIQSAPNIEIDTFAGDPLEYSYFIANFKDVVETLIDDQRGRLARLIKYTSGEAKELIKHCVHDDPNTCYDVAVKLLDKEYGNPFQIACAYIEKLRNWPTLKYNDAVALKSLYRFLLRCHTYQKKGFLEVLNSPLTIRNIQLKLPLNLQDKWTQVVGQIRKRKMREATFSDFVDFIETETANMNDPVYSRSGIRDVKRYDDKMKSFLTNYDTKNHDSVKCPCCEMEHDLDDCPTFLEKDISSKKKLVYGCKLCWGCYGVDHIAKECTKKRTCKICKRTHPTGLHDPKFIVSAVQHGQNKSDTVGMCIVPVRLSHKDFAEPVLVYAMLDECSQGTFIKEEILDMFDIDKRKTSLTVTTLNGKETYGSYAVEGFSVRCSVDHERLYPLSSDVSLPVMFSRDELPIDQDDVPDIEKIVQWEYLKKVADTFPKEINIPVGLLIGGNCHKALEPMEVVSSQREGPYAYRTQLGWCIVGPTEKCIDEPTKCNLTRLRWPVKDISTGTSAKHHLAVTNSIRDNSIKDILTEMWQTDFIENDSEKRAMSHEDGVFLKRMENNISMENGHYVLPLPFRKESPNLADNRVQALKRAATTKRKMVRDEEFCDDYVTFMNNLLEKGYARKAVSRKDESDRWYIPHHGVFHPAKKKIRVVFDCSALYQGQSLNNELIQGPDLTNNLVGILVRFRKESVAIMADIEAMYYQVRVPENQRKYLKFLWWTDGNLHEPPEDYEMCVHPFGAVSSPSCANYALQQTALDNKEKYGSDAAEVLVKDFYVDDMLKSIESEEKGMKLVDNTQKMCDAGGFNLTKFVCNNSKVIESLAPEKRCDALKRFEVNGIFPVERALGVHWSVKNDSFGFHISINNKALTRKGVLSTISSIYDPLGIAAPFLLKGRKILQEITSENVSWDADVSEYHASAWKVWQRDLPLLEGLCVPRCYHPNNFGKITDASLHCFSDASTIGYGAACYLRLVDQDGKISVSLVMGKSRVSPMKATTIPRMELTAATVSVKLGAMLKEELDIDGLRDFYWTDSQIVLGYILNDVKRFRVYVANRTQKIRSYTNKSQWKYVETEENPSDDASRGLSLKKSEKARRWLNGPKFLWQSEEQWNQPVKPHGVSDVDPEVQVIKRVNASNVKGTESLLDTLERRISDWNRMKRVMVMILTFIKKCKRMPLQEEDEMTVGDIQEAESAIIKMLQVCHFKDDINVLQKEQTEKVNISKRRCQLKNLTRLNPYIDERGVLRAGGRLKNFICDVTLKCPIILPKKTVITRRLIEWHHKRVEHCGRSTTINEIRSNGYWIISMNSCVRSVIHRCVRCRMFRGQVGEQQMASLPADRTAPEGPFTHSGVDMFGPFNVKEGRKILKRYCALFTCFASRAVHIEVTSNMETDSFIQALRRFIARRGFVRMIRSDNGGNFVGAENEMKKAWEEMDHSKVKGYLHSQNCDWIVWKRNTPVASHMGGVWERQIRTIRSVLTSLLKSHTRLLDDESLRTLLAEAEAIVNSRPLTVENINDPDSEVLTPNHLLTMKSRIVMPPPGVFQSNDTYCRKRWRGVQHMANVFWNKWRKEYLQTLQSRQKWTHPKRNFVVNDIVLLKDDSTVRNKWPMARVVEAYPSDDGLVRSVMLKISNSKTTLKRPITKVVLLMESEENSMSQNC